MGSTTLAIIQQARQSSQATIMQRASVARSFRRPAAASLDGVPHCPLMLRPRYAGKDALVAECNGVSLRHYSARDESLREQHG